jgi:uncharacterized membrane protein YvlD (DUF360 family)
MFMPFDEMCAGAVNSPVLGLYNSFALPVLSVLAVPLVALTNVGYKFVAVVVSFVIEMLDALEPL